MSTSKKTKKQSGGINVKGSVAADGDLVGRDKTTIHNIVLVGQFLDFAKVEGLIPKPSTPANFESVSAAFEATFNQRLDGDLAQATAFAGEVLGEVIQKERLNSPSNLLPFRTILKEVPYIFSKKLESLGYWDLFCSRNGFMVQLDSLELLWKKHFKTTLSCGIANYKGFANPYQWSLLLTHPNNSTICISIDEITNEEFRVIMAGLVIDLIRISSTASDDIKFWQGLVDLLGPEKKSG
jgi:hypothetical protein